MEEPEEEKKAEGLGKGRGEAGGRGGVEGEAAKLSVQLLEQARAPSAALGLPVATNSQDSSKCGDYLSCRSFWRQTGTVGPSCW